MKELQDNVDTPLKDNGDWPDDVVFTVYRNDDLVTLPILILKQMQAHLTKVIEDKEREACTHCMGCQHQHLEDDPDDERRIITTCRKRNIHLDNYEEHRQHSCFERRVKYDTSNGN